MVVASVGEHAIDGDKESEDRASSSNSPTYPVLVPVYAVLVGASFVRNKRRIKQHLTN